MDNQETLKDKLISERQLLCNYIFMTIRPKKVELSDALGNKCQKNVLGIMELDNQVKVLCECDQASGEAEPTWRNVTTLKMVLKKPEGDEANKNNVYNNLYLYLSRLMDGYCFRVPIPGEIAFKCNLHQSFIDPVEMGLAVYEFNTH